MSAEFGLLGTIEAHIDGRPVDALGHTRQRCVLAALLVDSPRAVTAEQLVERVWGDDPPRQALNSVYSSVSRLRRALAPAGEVRIDRGPGGYVVTTEADAVDLHRFRTLVARARKADDAEADALLEQALLLWRGDPFATVDTVWFNALRETLKHERAQAELDRHDLRLRLGDHLRLLSELPALVRHRPLDERLVGQLVLALYRGGRTAEALTRYEELRRRLADELGADPGPELRALHTRILTADPALTAPAAPVDPTAAPASGPVPRQLPSPPVTFTGRAKEITALDGLLADGAEPARTVVISAIAGAGGIGKTWLALQWAHHHLDRFPDGQLYANLRGFDPLADPMSPQTALRGFLVALGTDPEGVPRDLDGQSALYRSLTAGRRFLVLLDNARDTAQVAPLLPGGDGCTVVVTSRSRLPGLTAAHGARPLTLDVFAEEEAHALFTRLVGAERTAAEPAAVTSLLAYCAGLPLAVGILAARAATSPELLLAALADEVGEAHSGLDALDTGDVAADLRAVLTASLKALPPAAAQLFRLLGTVSGTDVDPYAAAALAESTASATRAALRALVGAHLLQEHAPGRYRMHDLTRLFAAERAARDESAAWQRGALQRYADFLLHTATAAVGQVDPRRTSAPGEAPAPFAAPQFTAYEQALDWLDAERENLTALVRRAHECGLHEHAWRLPRTLWPYYFLRGHLTEWTASHRVALAALGHLDAPAGHADTVHNLGTALWQLARYEEAAGAFEEAVDRRHSLGDHVGVASSLTNLAVVSYYSGRYPDALRHGLRSLALRRDAGDVLGESSTLTLVSGVLARMGRYEEALSHSLRSLDIFREQGDPHGEASARLNLGILYERLGRIDDAFAYGRVALAAMERLGHRARTALAYSVLATAHTRAGEHRTALELHREALSAAEGLDDPGELAVLDLEHAVSLQAAADHAGALGRARTGLAHAERARDPYEQARAHQFVADALGALGRSGEGATHRERARAGFAALGVEPPAPCVDGAAAPGGADTAQVS
ncbi:BTAD domain-containing putative transcriptional regulator [Streptomyces sp. NPDC017979]|uniref:AfsR/SARP family transcriptional regulator n=1 Tax=Streptomyces sp. NPDC017979 TaxID=3365024 RepID=UPI0037B5AD8F